ncbi:hypothetical protein LUZ61_012716 [Rhynchospora tenuis]|uniref:F-box domain-containing protein n=1 Tax=Rhynchospora tenuis TaxID=198213 RepID=A0AAD6A3M9_9POAL|nr:hypothetical protein LUZ61_012716 [Rhynchospora tenuis]
MASEMSCENTQILAKFHFQDPTEIEIEIKVKPTPDPQVSPYGVPSVEKNGATNPITVRIPLSHSFTFLLSPLSTAPHSNFLLSPLSTAPHSNFLHFSPRTHFTFLHFSPRTKMENAQIPVGTHLYDLPEQLLLRIFSFIEPTRARNSASLVCRRWRDLERRTRSSLSLRGNVITNPYHPHPFPRFPSVSSLDLSNLSPWGRVPSNTPLLVGPTLPNSFPAVTDLTLYSRDPTVLIALTHHWPRLKRVKLVRWHNRPSGADIGSDLGPLFENCTEIEEVDLSEFYCWTEDVAEAVRSHALVARNITGLDLMLANATDGFRTSELISISEACPNLRRLIAPCAFNPRCIDFINDATLLRIATNCTHLTTLHLVDTTPVTLNNNPGAANNLQENNPSTITRTGLETLFSSLPLLTDFSLDLSHPIFEAGPALEVLGQRCTNLIQNLKLGNFEGVCKGIWLHLNGVAICGGLKSLCLKRCCDVSDSSLVTIGRGCTRLEKFELIECHLVTELGIQKLAKKFEKRLRQTKRQTLKDLTVSQCALISAPALVKALEPLRDQLQRLQFDCIWTELDPKMKKALEEGFLLWPYKIWLELSELSLWLPAGEFLSPLIEAGLDDCPNLSSITIKVEGNCLTKPGPHNFGINALSLFPDLSKMKLDLGEAIGYAFSAPPFQTDLSAWEKFYLLGIEELPSLQELDYWPPQDRDLNRRTLSMVAAGLIRMSDSLRNLFIHGTTYEHIMWNFLDILSLRDAQLRQDYYPAPEDNTSTEMRDESCARFELKLNNIWQPY